METNKETIKSVTNCPTCGAECKIGTGDGNSHYYIPANPQQHLEAFVETIDKSLGEKINGNEYEINIYNGEFWITHKEVGSGEPLKQWLESVLTDYIKDNNL